MLSVLAAQWLYAPRVFFVRRVAAARVSGLVLSRGYSGVLGCHPATVAGSQDTQDRNGGKGKPWKPPPCREYTWSCVHRVCQHDFIMVGGQKQPAGCARNSIIAPSCCNPLVVVGIIVDLSLSLFNTLSTSANLGGCCDKNDAAQKRAYRLYNILRSAHMGIPIGHISRILTLLLIFFIFVNTPSQLFFVFIMLDFLYWERVHLLVTKLLLYMVK